MTEEFPEFLTTPISIEKLLPLLGYSTNKYGCLERRYGKLNTMVCTWIWGWRMIWNFVDKDSDSLGMSEKQLPNEIEPIEYLTILYSIWKHCFPMAEVHPELELGKQNFERKEIIRKLTPPQPHLWVDRHEFRSIVNSLKRQFPEEHQVEKLTFQFKDGVLEISAGRIRVCCAGEGSWVGSVTVESKLFFESLPKRFTRDRVNIVADVDGLTVNRNWMTAKWEDQ